MKRQGGIRRSEVQEEIAKNYKFNYVAKKSYHQDGGEKKWKNETA